MQSINNESVHIRVSDAMLLHSKRARCNHRLCIPHTQDNRLGDRATAAALRWGDFVAQLRSPFDLILAADVAYSAAALPALLSTIAALAGPNSHILFAFEARPPVTDAAVRLMPAHGLAAEEVPAAELHPDWRDPNMHVLHLILAA